MTSPVLAAALWAAAGARAQVRALPSAPAALVAPAFAVPATMMPSASATFSVLPVPSRPEPPLSVPPAPVPAALPVPFSPRSLSAPSSAPDAPKAVPVAPSAPDADRTFWDGASERPRVLPVRAPLRSRRAARLARLASPYRTLNQLDRLEKKPRAAGETFRFAVIGDAEPGRFWFSRLLFNRDRRAFWRLLARADQGAHDFIFQLGDMVSRGGHRNFRAFFRRLRLAAPRAPFLTVPGNHDRRKPHGITDSRLYRALFGVTSYYFDRAGWRFVVLDDSDGRLTPARLAWLARVLVKGRPTVVFTHMPPAPLGEWTDFGRKGAGGFREGSDAFMRLMSERGVSRVYMGHVHGFGVLDRGGVRYVLTGGGGSPLYPGPVKDRFHHYLSVEAGPSGLVETVHRADGSSFVPR